MPKTLLKKIPISEEEFLRKIEKMYGEYAIEDIACHMKSDFRYNSFWVLEEMKTAARYVDYITAKVQTLKKEKIVIQTVIAERSPKGLIARMDMMPAGFYRLVAHPEKKE